MSETKNPMIAAMEWKDALRCKRDAAEEMYEALNSLISWLRVHHEADDEFYLQSIEQAEKALAKADGRTA